MLTEKQREALEILCAEVGSTASMMTYVGPGCYQEKLANGVKALRSLLDAPTAGESVNEGRRVAELEAVLHQLADSMGLDGWTLPPQRMYGVIVSALARAHEATERPERVSEFVYLRGDPTANDEVYWHNHGKPGDLRYRFDGIVPPAENEGRVGREEEIHVPIPHACCHRGIRAG